MKKLSISLFYTLLCYILSLPILPGNATAQTVLPATGNGTILAYESNVSTLNSSYCAEYLGNTKNNSVYGVTWDDGLGHVKFVIGNNSGPLTPVSITPPAGYVSVSKPDIAVGADKIATTSFLWVGVIYLATTATGVTNVFMDIYPVNGSNNGGLSYTSDMGLPTRYIPITSAGIISNGSAPRIDAVTRTPAPGTAISTNWFAITWPDNGSVYMMYSKFRQIYNYALDPSVLATAKYASSHMDMTTFTEPDIATIECTNGSSTDVTVLLSEVDQNNNLYLARWNLTTCTLGAPQLLATDCRSPRIDAIDASNLNNPSASMAHYTIAYRDINKNICIYSDASSTPQRIIDNTLFPYFQADNPAIAYGPGNTYTAVYRVNNGDDIFAQQLDALSETLTSPNFHTVNYPGAYTNTSPSVAQLGNVCDNINNDIFVCGFDFVHGTIWYKTSANPLNFRGNNVGVNDLPVARQCNIYPNPATDVLTITIPERNGICDYMITDINGRAVKQGRLSSGDNILDIRNMSAGAYIVQTTGGNAPAQLMKFIKQ